jgi:hypothetical protein
MGVKLTVADIAWFTGERDVRALEAKGPKAIRRLDAGALRLGVYRTPEGLGWVELSVAQIRPGAADRRSSLRLATLGQLAEASKLEPDSLLRSAGVLEVGTKEVVLGHLDRRRNYLAALFPWDDQRVPVTSFVLTRVLPLLYEYEGETIRNREG